MTWQAIYSAKRQFIAFAILALAARALVPVGWMPSQAGAFTFEICADGKAATAWIDADGNLHKEKPGEAESEHQPCAFASVASADLSHPENPVFRPSLRTASQSFAWASISVGYGLAAPPPPQTGPPLLS